MRIQILFFFSISFILGAFKVPHNQLILKTYHQYDAPPKMPEIMLQKGCNLCHSVDKHVVGPSFKQISQAYKGDKEKLLKFLNGQSDAIVNPEEFTYMKPVINELKHISDADKKKIVDYILSFK